MSATDSSRLSSVAELLAGIRQGLVPRSVRLFASQGLLPVAREELIRVLVLLVAESDEEIATSSRATLASFSPAHVLAVLDLPDLQPLEIDLLARSVMDEALWQAIVRHPRTASQTLRWLAATAPSQTLDAIVTNQTRLLGCLEILGDLRGNPHVTQDLLRRVREFEEEFLEKAMLWASAAAPEPEIEHGPSIEEALVALKEIGMILPGGEIGSSFLPEVEPDAPREIKDVFVRLTMMTTYQRIMRALKGSREERLILVRERNLLVVRAVMMSPKLTESDVEQIAASRSANEEALRMIGMGRRWLRRYGVIRNLVFNPKSPTTIVLRLLGHLTNKDLAQVIRDRNVPGTVRRMAKEYRARKG